VEKIRFQLNNMRDNSNSKVWLCNKANKKISDRQTSKQNFFLVDEEKSLYEEQQGSEHCPVMQ